jgi:trimeric autotransporter adhesin
MQGRFNHWVRLMMASCLVVCLFFVGTRRVMGESAKGTWDSRFTLPPGLNGSVNAMVSMGQFLVVGGSFSRAGGVEARGVALWDGSRWWPLSGAGVDGPVYALALSNDGLYVGGIFSHAGGKPANNVAKWNGISWDSMGGGVKATNIYNGGVFALYVQNGIVYVGGTFSLAGNVPALDIAGWDGRAWHSLGGGVCFSLPLDQYSGTGFVDAITGDGVNIYVGGEFAQAGNVSAVNLARWNGRAWEAIGSTSGGSLIYVNDGNDYPGSVSTLAFYQSNLYVGGDFFGIGGITVTNFA